jgi:hypothetical protein
MDSTTLEVTVSDNKTVATIGAGDDLITFHLHGGTPESISADLRKIAESHGCTTVRIAESGAVGAALLRDAGTILHVELVETVTETV